MKWFLLVVTSLSVQFAYANDNGSKEREVAIKHVLSDQVFTNYKTTISRELLYSENSQLHVSVSVQRPRYNGLQSASFATVNNPAFEQNSSVIRLSISKNF